MRAITQIMGNSINLDRQPGLATEEIQNVRAGRMLSSKLKS
jgi:hypothetical protein